EPPGPLRLVRVVSTQQQHPAVAVKQQHSRGLARDRRGLHRDGYQPRSARRWGSGTSSTLMPTIASPKPRDTSAITEGSSKNVVAFTMALARSAGLPDLKMPEPT